jgi:uncharacterized spore protein YtfJ
VDVDPQLVLSGAQDAMAARRVFGDPIASGDAIVLPAAIISGGGGGGGTGTEGGAGFGVRARPAGVFVIRNGHVSWRPAVDVNRAILGGQLVAITALLTLRPILLRWLSTRAAA